jgi:hypothetical protein
LHFVFLINRRKANVRIAALIGNGTAQLSLSTATDLMSEHDLFFKDSGSAIAEVLK